MENFLSKLFEELASLSMSVGMKLLYAILILIVGHYVVKFIVASIDKAVKKNQKLDEKIDEGAGKFLLNTVNVALHVLIVITAALVLGVPATSFITVLGSAGLALGLALQGSLSNLAGGIMILVYRPFRVGDFIEVSGISGTVDEINFFYTVLHSLDNKRITVPNGTASNAVVTDYSALETRRVDFEFSAAYGSDVEKVKAILLAAASSEDKVLKDPAPVSYLSEHSDSSIKFILRCWCENADYWTVHFDIIEKINTEFAKNGIEIPFPQMDVHVKN